MKGTRKKSCGDWRIDFTIVFGRGLKSWIGGKENSKDITKYRRDKNINHHALQRSDSTNTRLIHRFIHPMVLQTLQNQLSIKMDHRFSTLFFQPPSLPPSRSSTETTMSGALPDPKTLARSKSATVKKLLRKIFGIQGASSRQKQKTDPLVTTKTSEPGPSELSQSVWRGFGSSGEKTTVKDEGGSKDKKKKKSEEGGGAIVVMHPTRPAQVFRREIFRKSSTSTSSTSTRSNSIASSTTTITNKKRSTTRDSKFSSISSLPSIAALSLYPSPRSSSPGPSIAFSLDELAILQSLIRRIARGLKKQEYLTSHLAGNLVHLFGRKEAQIMCLKRVRVADREAAAREVWRVRESVGRGFLRRGVLVGRGEGVSTSSFCSFYLFWVLGTASRGSEG